MATSIGVKLGIDGEAEYRKQLNNIIQSTKTLDKQMGELQSSFSEETDAMEKNAKETELLQKKAEKLNEEVEMMQKMVEAAAEKFGEGSTECQKWQQSLASAQTELNKTNAELTTHQQEAEQANSALGQLTSTISDQETELSALKDEYINAVLEFGEGSDEASALADEISNLSGELADNQAKLDAANQALSDLTGESDGTKSALQELTDEISNQQAELDTLRDSYIDAVLEFGEGSDEVNSLAGEIQNLSAELANNQARLDEARGSLQGVEDAVGGVSAAENNAEGETDELVGKFSSAFPGMTSIIEAAGTAGVIGAIVEALIELGKQAIEAMNQVQEASNEMIRATLLTGEGLKDAEDAAYNAYLKMNDANVSMKEMEAIGGTLYTRLGLTGEALEDATLLFGKYSSATGVDGVNAVNDLVDVMRKWGLETEDDATNLEILAAIMDRFTYGQAQGKLSVDDITNALADQKGVWTDVGYSMDDAVAFLSAYTNAGGDASQVTSALNKMITQLDGKTDNMGKSWKDAVQIMSTAKDRTSALGTVIGDTGVTIEQAFGKQAAGKMIDVFMDSKVQADNYSKALETVRGTTDDLYDATRTVSDGIDSVGKQMTNYEMIMFQQSRQIEEMFSNMSDASEQTSTDVQTDYDDVQKKLHEGVDIQGEKDIAAFAQSADSNFAGIQNSYGNMKYNLENSPIKLKVTAPQIEYHVSGSGNNAKYKSSATYETFAAAYDQAMILSAPTIFGAMGGSLLVGGDRPGNEIVVGESHLMHMFTEAVKRASASNINIVVNGAEGQNVNELADIVIDKLQMQIIGSEAVYA